MGIWEMNRFSTLCIGVLLSVIVLYSTAASQPYEIGHRSHTFIDPSRSNRQIPTEVYYPAETGGNDVPVAPPMDLPYPLVSFGHGYLMGWDSYENIWTALVPEGFVVALPRTEMALFPDHMDLGLDLAFVISALRTENNVPTSPYFAVLDSAAAVMGHSMGGGASVLAAASDTTVDAVANMAAAETNPSAISAAASVVVPVLMFSGTNDVVAPPDDHQIPIFNALASDAKIHVSVIGASHCQFAEYNFTCELGEIGGPGPDISRAEQHEIVNRLLLPWLRAVLFDDIDEWYVFEDSLAAETGILVDFHCSGVSPRSPQGLTVSVENGIAALSWNSVPWVSAYRIYASDWAWLPFESWAFISEISGSLSWTGSVSSDERYFRITATR